MKLSEFPQELVKDRNLIEMNFVFSLYKNPELIGDYINLTANEENGDIRTESGIFYFNIIVDLFKLGYKVIDKNTMYSYIRTKDCLLETYEEYNGWDAIEEMMSVVNINNFDTYFDALVKNNIFLNMQEHMSVLKYLDKLKNANSEEVYNFFDYKLSNIVLKQTPNIDIVNFNGGYDSFVDDWNKGKSMGFPIEFPLLNSQMAGVHKGNLILHCGYIGEGKEQPLSAKIVSENGFVTMGSLKIGDKIFGEDGELHKVIGIFPKGEKPIYELTLSNGAKTRCGLEHLWEVYTWKQVQKKYKNGYVWNTEKLIKELNERSNDSVNGIFLKKIKPVNYKEKQYELAPHVLGSLIADGDSVTNCIPTPYKYGSINQRLGLLAGLINTGGCIDKNRVLFSTSSETLANDVFEICNSLGFYASVSSRNRIDKSKEYIVKIVDFDLLVPYFSEKHKNKLCAKKKTKHLKILSIKEVGKEECRCIKVDNPTEIYLTDNYIPTHNTTTALLFYIMPMIEAGVNIVILANEQDEEQFRQMILATVLFNKIKYFGMNRQKFIFGGFSNENMENIKKATAWLNAPERGKIEFVHFSDYNIDNVKKVIKKYSKIGYGAFLFDTMKPENDMSDRSWGEFSEMAKTLFLIAHQCDVALIATAQLAMATKSRRYLDLDCIGKAKSIAETASQVTMFRVLRRDEKEKLKPYTWKKGKNPDDVWERVEHDLDLQKDYIALFIPKNRYGEPKIIVYQREMNFNRYFEIGYADIEPDYS